MTANPEPSQTSCEVPECVALAIVGGRCVIHQAVDRVSFDTRCNVCSKTIKAGAWHKHDGLGRSHFPRCPKPIER